MKKYIYIFVLCLFASMNLFCYCEEFPLEEDRSYFTGVIDETYSMEGAIDTVDVPVNVAYVMARPESDLSWTIEYGTDYDWHGSEIKEIHLSPITEVHDSLDGGWFQVKKLTDVCWAGLEIKVQPNTTGKNRYAEIELYHSATGAVSQARIYQESK